MSTLQGSWLSHLEFDNKMCVWGLRTSACCCDGRLTCSRVSLVRSYWHVESEPVFEHMPVENPLPSDSRFREDVLALKVRWSTS